VFSKNWESSITLSYGEKFYAEALGKFFNLKKKALFAQDNF